MKIYSWNVNGIRAVHKKGELLKFFDTYNPDILCIQETKAQAEQLDESILEIPNYHYYIESAEKKGYSGVLVYSKEKALSVRNMGNEEFDCEGRYIEIEYADFTLINCYFPNSQNKGKRLDYKLGFNHALQARVQELTENGVKAMICGDYNVAHTEIDLKNPKTNTKNAGFLPEERQWMSEFLNAGMIDTFRAINGDTIKYSWWSYRMNARERNIGWRIDYFCINQLLKNQLTDAQILNEVFGSDHCPVMIEIKK